MAKRKYKRLHYEDRQTIGADRGIQRDLFKPLRSKGSAGEYAPEIREHRRTGRQLFTRRTGAAYSIGESKRGIPYNRRTQT